MRKLSLRIAAVAAALALAAPAAATNGMRMIGYGPIQNSMGGASAAAALDASTIVSNPAGLSALDQRLDVSGTAFMPTVKYNATGAASGNTLESNRPTDYIPTLGAVTRVGDRLTVGIAALGMAGMGVEYATDLYGSSTKTSYLNMRFAPAVAYRLSDQVSLGLAANLSYAQMQYAVMGNMMMPPRDTAGSFGYGATLGLRWTTNEKVTLAAVYETKSRFQDFEWNIPAHDQVVGFDGSGNPIVMHFPGGKEKLSFDQPDVATVGAAFRPVDPLLVAFDLEWIRWSQSNGKGMPEFTSDLSQTGGMAWDMSWSDQLVFKLGAQYDVTKAFQVRAGYNYGQSPLQADRAFENIAFPAIAKHHITVGAGYAFGAVAVNASAMYSPEATLGGSNRSQYIGSYETKMSQLAFDLGATWKF
ncbi:MAG TPA: outer membrane protein transport protein [Anaeromyxobacter sp.]